MTTARRVQTLVTGLAAITLLNADVAGQGGGGGNAPRFPTKQQFEASAEAQQTVASVRAKAGADLRKEFENTCSATGPQRAALAREAEGLPAIKDYTAEPTKIFDNLWYVGLASQGAFVPLTLPEARHADARRADIVRAFSPDTKGRAVTCHKEAI